MAMDPTVSCRFLSVPQRRVFGAILASAVSLLLAPIAVQDAHAGGEPEVSPDGPPVTGKAIVDVFGRDLRGPVPVVVQPKPGPTIAPGHRFPAGPLPANVVAAFRGIQADPAPKRLTNGKHYIISNERRLDFWHKSMPNPGGVFVGVGTDQNYVLAGWGKPEIMVLMDFDQLVVDLQYVYWAFFRAAETPEAFIALWTPDRAHRRDAKALIAKSYEDQPAIAKAALAAYRYSPATIFKRLTKSRVRFAKYGAPSFLNDAEQYRFVRQMVLENRVFTVRGDLLANRTVTDIGKVSAQFELKVRVLYLSNTEMYFNWVRGFKPNMSALPMDDKSLVLRTLPVKPADYRYVVQGGPNFQSWIQAKGSKSVWKMYDKRRRIGVKGVSRLFVIDAKP